MKQARLRDQGFQNVDLDLTFAGDVELLLRELGESAMQLNRIETFASFDLRDGFVASADEAIAGFAELVRGLSPEARAVWDGCLRRTMNVGVDGPVESQSFLFGVSSRSIASLVELGADLVFTVYRPKS